MCFVADFSAGNPEAERTEEGGGGGVAAASPTLPVVCQLEEGKERRRRRGRGALERVPPTRDPGSGEGGRCLAHRGPAEACGTRRREWRGPVSQPHLECRSVSQPLGVGEGRPLRGPAP